MAFWAACKTVFASCAEAAPAHRKNTANAIHNRFAIAPPISLSDSNSEYGFGGDHTPRCMSCGSGTLRKVAQPLLAMRGSRAAGKGESGRKPHSQEWLCHLRLRPRLGLWRRVQLLRGRRGRLNRSTGLCVRLRRGRETRFRLENKSQAALRILAVGPRQIDQFEVDRSLRPSR